MQQQRSKKNGRIQQVLLLNVKGEILESDNQLFSIGKTANHSMITCFPIIASMFSSLLQLEKGAKTIHVPGVAPSCEYLSGFYDFHFKRVDIDDKILFEISIEDCTEEYTILKNQMQAHNDSVIKAEYDKRNIKPQNLSKSTQKPPSN